MLKKILMVLILIAFSSFTISKKINNKRIPNLIKISCIDYLINDTRVSLEAHLISKIKEDHYIFKDSSGELEVKIKEQDYKKSYLNEGKKIRIIVDVDHEWKSTEIKVEILELVKEE